MVNYSKIFQGTVTALILGVGIHSSVAFAHDKHQSSAANEYVAAASNTLSLTDLQAVVTNKGITSTEIKVKGLLLEIEGYDTAGREVELMLDRRSGDIMHFEYDD
ncbi:PepSY domain-containing protein [Kordiimonas pumila]|uniref:PepSY domain-containing protein n=1 Tax=Kordiimonas pumila TaxID=2161677 RepID=A0ABV7D5S5_9PROT|nr:PepSY domain-containing protein [Kordiimonas pumila]